MMMKFLNMFLVATAMVFLMNMHQHEAGRVFNGDRNLMETECLLLGSLSGPSTNPTPNPPTHIPAPTKDKVSTINQQNFAGHTQPPPRHPPSGPLMDNEHLLLGSLADHGPTIPSPNPPTYIPGPSKAKSSTINPKNFAGHTQLPPPFPPRPFSTAKQLLFVMAMGRK